VTSTRRSFHCLVNPSSGGGAAPGSAVPVARLLREAGATVQVTYSPGPLACADLARQAASRGDVVVAVGGDGMLSSVATAVVDAGGVLGVVPSGRGNDFARMLGLAADPHQVAHTLLEGEPVAVDVIDTRGRVVLGGVYAGVDSLASEIVDRATDDRADGGVGVLQPPRQPAGRVYDGTRVDLDEVLVLRGRRVTLAGAGVTAYGDGERLGQLPVTATVRPASLRVPV
jgi:diacylglycerol kinase family enzyme